MVINTNLEAQNTAENLNVAQQQLADSLARLSSGTRIVNPADDAAGLAVSSRMGSQLQHIDGAINNVGNALFFTQMQDGYLGRVETTLARMGELAILARDLTKSEGDRAMYNEEFLQLKSLMRETQARDLSGTVLFDGATWEVTDDANGSKFSITKPDLSAAVYQNAIADGTATWTLSTDVWKVSKDGYVTQMDLWKDTNDIYHTVPPAGVGPVKIDKGTFLTTQPVLAGPIMNMEFDGNLVDASGATRTVTVNGATPATDGNGDANMAYQFDGVDDSITISIPDKPYPLTVSVWFYPKSGSASMNGLVTSDGSGSTVYNWALAWDTSSGNKVTGDVAPTGSGTANVMSDGAFTGLNTWHHALMTYDGETQSTYIDGSLVSSATGSSVVPISYTGDEVVTLGYFPEPVPQYFKGKIDDVVIYNRALSTSEVSTLNSWEDLPDAGKSILEGGYVAVDPTVSGTDTDADATKIASNSTVSTDPTAADSDATANTVGTELTSVANAESALTSIETAITQAATDRAELGAAQARLYRVEAAMRELKLSLSKARSSIIDADIALEATEYARQQVLV